MVPTVADVNRRPYDATGRQQRATANRVAMLDAAVALLLERGYAETTLALVAEQAGVAAPTVYKAFGNKPGLMKAAFDYAAAGDDDPTPIPQRERAARILSEPDPVRKLEIYTSGMIERLNRAAQIQLIARGVAAVDPEVRVVWERMTANRHTGMGIIAGNLADGGHLREGVSKQEATDVLWSYTSPELYELMVLTRGWSPRRYRDWVCKAMVDALLPARP